MSSRARIVVWLGFVVWPAAAGAKPGTFEDIYGPSGRSFRGALGFRVAEASQATGEAQPGFGVALDDMVVQWREFKLVEDATSCTTSGACATVEVDSGFSSEANGIVTISVVDSSPYGLGSPVNDCNLDGDFVDAQDDADCDDDGTDDVVVRATSVGEPAGERVVLDRVGTSSLYRGTLPISAVGNAAGILYFVDAGDDPEVVVRYDDRWDGTAAGTPCRNSSSAADWGVVTTGIEISLVKAQVSVVKHRVADAPGSGSPPLPAGQDGDGFPDTNETVDLYLTLRNPTSIAYTNVVAQVVSSDPKVDCILSSQTRVASVPAHSNVEMPDPVRLKIASTADRSGVVPPVSCTLGVCSNGAGACAAVSACKKTTNDPYAATLSILLASDQFEASTQPQTLALELDLDSVNPVQATSTFIEGFEGGLGNMTLQNLDDGIASNSLSDGRRCQYNDPDFPGSNSYGNTECYLGFVGGQPIVNDWHLHDTTLADGGRAAQGVRSLHYGVHAPGNPLGDSYAMSQMDAIRTKNAINLAARVCRDDPAAGKRACNSAADCVTAGGGPCVSASPELSFEQQISTGDSRIYPIPAGQAADRGVVQVQVGSAAWQKVAPYQNTYDVQGSDRFSSCTFDPIDDGNTEDDYFDPTDPHRRFGPSSTCMPEFSFSYLGDTDAPFSTQSVGRASEGPGLIGTLGIGTWVESKFDLSRFRGRQIRIRWLFTSIHSINDSATYEALFHWNPNPIDDGWYVDDVRVTQTVGASAPTISHDTLDHSGLPGCGVACNSVSATLAATPASLAVPGASIVLSTLGSVADRCVDGVLLTEYWVDGDANGTLGDPADLLLRAAGVDPVYVDAPRATTHYAARVTCSSAPALCSFTAFAVVTVGCPGAPGTFEPEAWWNRLRFASATTIEVPPANQLLDAVRGDLFALRASGSFGGEVCLADGSAATTLVDALVPSLGGGFYYLMRGADAACNENRSWSTFSPKENPGAPGRRDAQITGCAP
jgi:hypothetical protein